MNLVLRRLPRCVHRSRVDESVRHSNIINENFDRARRVLCVSNSDAEPKELRCGRSHVTTGDVNSKLAIDPNAGPSAAAYNLIPHLDLNPLSVSKADAS